MKKLSLKEIREIAFKKENTFYHVFITEPLSVYALYALQNVPFITPNGVSFFGLFLMFASASAFYTGSLIIGASLYFIGYFADSLDGKLARIRGTSGPLGGFIDTIIDVYRQLLLALGLGVYLYHQSDPLHALRNLLIAFTYVALVAAYGALCAAGFALNQGKQAMNLLIEGKSKSLLVRVKLMLRKHRLRLGYTTAETNGIAFLLFPVLAAFFGLGFITYGFILASLMVAALTVVFVVIQAKILSHQA